MKNKIITKNKWNIVIIITVMLFVGIGIFLYVDISSNDSYTWEDHSGGELNIVRGTYKGKTNTFYLHDNLITEYNSLSISFSGKAVGSISFYFQYANDNGGEVSMDFYSNGQIFSSLPNTQNSILSDIWYLVVLEFNCNTDSGEVWIDGILSFQGDFTISDVDYCDGVVIRTNIAGRIDTYISGISIS